MKDKTVEQRLYQSYVLGSLLVIAISLSVTLFYSISWQQEELDSSILGMSAVVANMPLVVEVLEQKEVDNNLNQYLDGVRKSIDNLNIITICDTNSIRFYHPEQGRFGQRFVGGDEAEILEGSAPYISDGTGTLGEQRRAFHAVHNKNGEIIGFVMVSIFTESIRTMRNQILFTYGLVAIVLLSLGFAMAHHNMSYLKRLLLGHKPEEFVTKYVERSEVLDALDEGIFAVNPKGEVILMNQSAREMLGLNPEEGTEGQRLESLYPETRLLDIMKTGKAEYNTTMILNGNHILTNRIPIREHDKIAGAISIFRNKTEVMQMAEELTGARYMLDTLRAFNHEFMNKLHVILGYIQLGENQAAIEYISHTTLVSSQTVKEVSTQIRVPHLTALLIGKMMKTNEMGIHLVLKNGSHCTMETMLLPIESYVTIVGNLIENAIEELNAHNYPVKEVELGIYCDCDCSVITCEDTGGGIPEELREHILEWGISTKGEGRGAGLPLIKDLTSRYHGSIAIETEVGEGTCVTVSFLHTEGEEPICTEC